MYQPTPSDIAWAAQVVRLVTDGGIWAFPAIGQLYKINHEAKTVTLVAGDPDTEYDEMTTATFAEVGYQTLYPQTHN